MIGLLLHARSTGTSITTWARTVTAGKRIWHQILFDGCLIWWMVLFIIQFTSTDVTLSVVKSESFHLHGRREHTGKESGSKVRTYL